MTIQDATKRFSNRVANYVKYRPDYPTAVLHCLQEGYGLTETAVVVDIGSGTGLLTRLFLENGNRVYGVEPNQEMREAGETYLAAYPRFTSVNGTAENSTLPSHSADFVVAGQAFHWFDPQPTRAEFLRILKPTGVVALIWNERYAAEGTFMAAFEQLLQQYAISYKDIKQTGSYPDIAPFFGGEIQSFTFTNMQRFDLEGLQGRFLSSSYAPLPGHPAHQPMMQVLNDLFFQWQENGRIQFEYQTQVFVGRFGKSA